MKRTTQLLLAGALGAILMLPSYANAQLKDLSQKNKVATSEAKATTLDNLQEAYKGETTASAKYAAYSQKAEDEGYHEIAMLFKAASKSESIHAGNHKAVLAEAGRSIPDIKPEFTVKSTKENLMDAIAGETYEIKTMYPRFINNAQKIRHQLALISFSYAYKTEQKHKAFYEKALASLNNNTFESLPTVYFVCPTCGNTYETESPKRCGISMTSGDRFIEISD